MGGHYWQMHGHSTTGAPQLQGPASTAAGVLQGSYRARQRLLRGVAALAGVVDAAHGGEGELPTHLRVVQRAQLHAPVEEPNLEHWQHCSHSVCHPGERAYHNAESWLVA